MNSPFNLAGLFSQKVREWPEAVAVEFNDRSLTYRELDERSWQLAACLLRQGVRSSDLVAICLQRGMDMLVSILGVLKVGAAYVPLDPSYPSERLAFILEDCSVDLVLTDEESRRRLPVQEGVKLLDVAHVGADIGGIRNMPNEGAGLAYIIYTSGSTGTPKGVAVEHASVLSLIQCQSDEFGIGPDERILQFSNYCFDASVEQIFLALLNGATLVLFPEGLQRDAGAFTQLLNRRRITHLHATPSFLEVIDPAVCSTLKRVIAGGEACPRTLAARWAGKVRFYNEYGPTETTVTSIEYAFPVVMNDDLSLPIGRPLRNTFVYLLDEQLRPVPPGHAGELFLGGGGLARGYINRPGLTAERFLPDPFRDDPGARMYRTGDRVRLLPDGNLEYLGRMDDQVKIRGYRIEPGEIEAVLYQSGMIRQGVVAAWPDARGDLRLVAYLVAGPEYDREAVRSWLAGKLPEYMLPSHWVELASLPFTPSGKVDKQALPKPIPDRALPTEHVTVDYAVADKLEEEIASIWRELLGVSDVGRDETFFELGGHSLLLARLSVSMNKHFGIEIPPILLFEDPTVARLAAWLREAERSVKADAVDGFDPKQVSSSQVLFFMHHKLHPGETFPNTQLLISITGPVDLTRLGRSLETVIRRNDALRTSYYLEKGKVLQRLEPVGQLSLSCVSLEKTGIGDTVMRLTTPFDFGSAPLLRAFYILSETGPDHLYIDMPHINSDGTTADILLREVVDAYNGTPAPAPLQFSDYQRYLGSYLRSQRYSEDRAFWEKEFGGDIPVIPFGCGFEPQGRGHYKGTTFQQNAAAGLLTRIQQYVRGKNLTPFHLLLAAYVLLLKKLTGADDIPVMVPVQNRSREGFSSIMGLLANILIVRIRIPDHLTPGMFFQACKDKVNQALHHQEFPYEDLCGLLKKAGIDLRKTPLAQTFFNYHVVEAGYRLGDATLHWEVPAKENEVLPLSVDLFDMDSELVLRISSLSGGFSHVELRKITAAYFDLLDCLLTTDESPMANILWADNIILQDEEGILSKPALS